MLKQAVADALLALPKELVEAATIEFPIAGDSLQLEANSQDGNEAFLFDVNRRGKIKLSQCTFQERYAIVEILLRLDVDGPPHVNPDGTDVPCPHLHTYREGFGDKWAYPLPTRFSNPADLIVTFREFLKYCNVRNVPSIQKAL